MQCIYTATICMSMCTYAPFIFTSSAICTAEHKNPALRTIPQKRTISHSVMTRMCRTQYAPQRTAVWHIHT